MVMDALRVRRFNKMLNKGNCCLVDFRIRGMACTHSRLKTGSVVG